MKKRVLLLGVGLTLGMNFQADAHCPNLPVAWVDPGGRPVSDVRYQSSVQACSAAADYFSSSDWRLQFVSCMRKRGFKPVYHGIFC